MNLHFLILECERNGAFLTGLWRNENYIRTMSVWGLSTPWCAMQGEDVYFSYLAECLAQPLGCGRVSSWTTSVLGGHTLSALRSFSQILRDHPILLTLVATRGEKITVSRNQSLERSPCLSTVRFRSRHITSSILALFPHAWIHTPCVLCGL